MEDWGFWQEKGNDISSYATVVLRRGGRKEQSSTAQAARQRFQHYCFVIGLGGHGQSSSRFLDARALTRQ